VGVIVDWALVAVPVMWALWRGCQALGCKVGLNEWAGVVFEWAVGVWGGCRVLGCEVRLNEWVGSYSNGRWASGVAVERWGAR